MTNLIFDTGRQSQFFEDGRLPHFYLNGRRPTKKCNFNQQHSAAQEPDQHNNNKIYWHK